MNKFWGELKVSGGLLKKPVCHVSDGSHYAFFFDKCGYLSLVHTDSEVFQQPLRYLFWVFLCDAEQCDEAAPADQKTVVLTGSMPAVALIDLKTARTYLPYSL
jgi:hypothetical protein